MLNRWATIAIQRLQAGKDAIVIPQGNSMYPRILSGSTVTLEPCTLEQAKIGDIVLCCVRGGIYLHLVKEKQDGQVLIVNNRGRVNGWTTLVYGRAIDLTWP